MSETENSAPPPPEENRRPRKSARSATAPLLRGYVERDPKVAAHILESMDETDAAEVVMSLPSQLCARIFPHLPPNYAAALLKKASPDLFMGMVRNMKPNQVVDLLVNIDSPLRKTLMDQLPPQSRREIQDLLQFPEDSAGRIMSTSYLAFNHTVKVKEAVQRIRILASRQVPTTYAYVVDDGGRLVGILNMRDLLVAPGDAPLEAIMAKDLFSVNGFMDREEVAHLMAKKNFFAVPVVDSEGRLLGVVKTDQLIGSIQEEASEDLLKMVGAGEDEKISSSIAFSLRKRLPWLHINLATAFLAASVVALFEGVISRVTVLAVFLPVVAGQGGNAGAQSLAVVMRGLVMREVRPAQGIPVVMKEMLVGVYNGVIIGLVTALAAWAWKGNPFLGLVIGLAMIVNLTVAGLSGAAIPLLLKAFGFDPAQSSSIVLTTITDVVGFFAFLGFAALFQSHLV